MIHFGNFTFRNRNFLFPLVLLGSVLISKPLFSPDCKNYDRWLDIVGVIVALLGQGLRIVTIGYEYIKRGGVNKKIYAEDLVTGGVFSHSRNPLYLGNLLVWLGLAFMANSWVVYSAAIPFYWISYMALILAEENFLLHKFGQSYQDYCSDVNRLWPRWKGFRDTVYGMRFNWKRVINKEHGSFFAWTFSAVFIHIWSEFHDEGFRAINDGNSIGLLVLLGLSYSGVRILKRKRLLEDNPKQ